MTTPITGYTRDEFIAQLQDTVGDNSTSFLSQCQNNITSWVQQFYCLADWKFTYKNGVADSFSFDTVNNQSIYTISTANMGYESQSFYIESIYSQTQGYQRKLIKQELVDLRVGDPGQEATGFATYWFPSGEKGIELWPTPVTGNGAVETLFIDGKVIGQEINSDVSLPIPYMRQDLFFQFCLYKCLRRRRDPAAIQEYKMFLEELRMNINDEMRDEETNLRVKTVNEQLGTGFPQGDLNMRLWYTPNW